LRYRLYKAFVRLWLHRALRIAVEGLEHVPVAGPAILAVNHPSAIDGALLVDALPRRLMVFSRAENFADPLSRWVLSGAGALPTGLAADDEAAFARNLDAFERAERWLRDGELVLTAPEGDVNPGPRLLPFRSGFAQLALETGAPIVPTAIVGSERALRDPRRPGPIEQFRLRPASVRIAFLPPVRAEPGPDGRAARDRCVEKVRARIASAVADRIA
jgi:1-acyl-sn-glycerol-3-phosphate acyltransferase